MNAHDRICILIERIASIEDIKRDGVLFDLIGFTSEGFLT